MWNAILIRARVGLRMLSALATAAALMVPVAGRGPHAQAAPGRLPAAFPAAGVSTGIDGFKPILYNETGPQAGLKAWFIAHHGYVSPTAAKITCIDVATATVCPDKNGSKPFPLPLNTNAVNLDTNNPGDIATTETPQFAMDPSLPRVYYPAVTTTSKPGFTSGSVGVGCVNLQTQANCAYTPLLGLTNTVGQSNVNGLTGFTVLGTQLYGTATNGKEVCYDMSNHQACAGQPYTTNSPPSADKAGLGPTDYYGSTATVNNKIYIASNAPAGTTTTTHAPAISCFDPGPFAPCTGWSTPKTFTDPNANWSLAVFPRYNNAVTQIGVCAVAGNKTAQAPILACYDFSGNSVAPPAGMAGLFPTGGTGSVVFQPMFVGSNGTFRIYFPFFSMGGANRGSTLCYNWTAQAPCSSFTNPATHPTVNGGNTHDYGYAYDSTTACLYGGGDRGYMFSLNPLTGATGC
jgi:hypothetical protein